MFLRILINTRKHIWRSGWIGWASVFVMTLAFLVATIFGSMAFIADLYLQHFESQSNILVFFEVGMDDTVVERLKKSWSEVPEILEIEYLSEDEAFSIYYSYTAKAYPEQHEVLGRFESKKLPSSLEIKLASLDDFETVKEILRADIDSELEYLIIHTIVTEVDTSAEAADLESEEETVTTDEAGENVLGDSFELAPEDVIEVVDEGVIQYKYSDDPTKPPISLVTDDESIEVQKDIYSKLRFGGMVALGLLSVFVVIFIFMTVEFRLYNQKEEIGVMQLVGGSLLFIRAPYILEGGFYGAFGALLATGILAGSGVLLFVVEVDKKLAQYIYQNFGHLPWPEVSTFTWIGVVALLIGFGFLLGALSSYLSIRRYIR